MVKCWICNHEDLGLKQKQESGQPAVLKMESSDESEQSKEKPSSPPSQKATKGLKDPLSFGIKTTVSISDWIKHIQLSTNADVPPKRSEKLASADGKMLPPSKMAQRNENRILIGRPTKNVQLSEELVPLLRAQKYHALRISVASIFLKLGSRRKYMAKVDRTPTRALTLRGKTQLYKLPRLSEPRLIYKNDQPFIGLVWPVNYVRARPQVKKGEKPIALREPAVQHGEASMNNSQLSPNIDHHLCTVLMADNEENDYCQFWFGKFRKPEAAIYRLSKSGTILPDEIAYKPEFRTNGSQHHSSVNIRRNCSMHKSTTDEKSVSYSSIRKNKLTRESTIETIASLYEEPAMTDCSFDIMPPPLPHKPWDMKMEENIRNISGRIKKKLIEKAGKVTDKQKAI